MDLERSKELRDYLRTTLHLPFAFPEPEEDPEFYDKVHIKLKPHFTLLCDALENAYPNEKKLSLLVKREWEKDLGEIPHGDSYADKLRNTIEWMEAEGYLLEFIAAAHQNKARNPRLNSFVRKALFTLLEPPVSTQQISPSELPLKTSSPSAADFDVRANHHGSEISKGAANRDIKSLNDETSGKLSALEEGQDNNQIRPTPFPRKIIPIDNQPQGDPIALAYGRTHAAQEKMQLVYEVFQASRKFSEPQIVEFIEQAKKSIDGISDLFVNIPTPDYLELDYRFACEERYICERISIVAAYSLRDEYINLPSIFQGADREFKKIFSGLQNLENFIKQYQEQFQLSDLAGNSFLGNSS